MMQTPTKISWLPEPREFMALLGNDPVSKLTDVTISWPSPARVITYPPTTGMVFARDELQEIERRYNMFRELIDKLLRTDCIFKIFRVHATNLQTFIKFSYLSDLGRPIDDNYIRDGFGDWFPDDLLNNLRRLTKDVEPETQSTLVVEESKTDEEKVQSIKDFSIGDHFKFDDSSEVVNRVTDIGTRVIVYIRLDQQDERNYNGPPYSIREGTADEYDIPHLIKVAKP